MAVIFGSSVRLKAPHLGGGYAALVVAASAFWGVVGCDKVTNPSDVNVTKLKPPMNLQVVPVEDGITLTWNAVNKEEDFSGYNVYIASDTANALKDFQALSMMQQDTNDEQNYSPIYFRSGEKDEEIEGTRANLWKYFNWDSTAVANKDGTTDKTFTPIAHCNTATTDTGGECKVFTDSDTSIMTNRANGIMTLTLTGGGMATPTNRYLVFVAATANKGKKIGSPTSNVQLVAGHKKRNLASQALDFATNGVSAKAEKSGVNLAETVKDGSPYTHVGFTPKSGTDLFCLSGETDATKKAAQDKVHIYFEMINSDLNPTVTGANGTRIADLGPVMTDFDAGTNLVGATCADNAMATDKCTSSLLDSLNRIRVSKADKFVALVPKAEATPSSAAPSGGDLGSTYGYSRCGQSVYLHNHHVYGIAYPGSGDTSGKYRYALLETGKFDTTSMKFDLLRVVVGNGTDRRF